MKLALSVGLVALIALIVSCNDDNDGVMSPSPSEGASASMSQTGDLELLTASFEGDDGTTELLVELADTPDERYQGLRNRQSMEEDRGMLFAWPADATSAFGMPETYIPLTIAFIREDGEIIHIEDMEPLSMDPHRSPEPYRYAIEANQGWYEENGIGIGDLATIPEDAAAAAQ